MFVMVYVKFIYNFSAKMCMNVLDNLHTTHSKRMCVDELYIFCGDVRWNLINFNFQRHTLTTFFYLFYLKRNGHKLMMAMCHLRYFDDS